MTTDREVMVSVTTDPPAWLTLGRAATRLGVSVGTVRRLIDDGRLTLRAVPGAWPKVRADEVDALAEASTTSRKDHCDDCDDR